MFTALNCKSVCAYLCMGVFIDSVAMKSKINVKMKPAAVLLVLG